MHLFIEKGMRAGILYICERYSKANNKYIQCHDSNKKVKLLCIGMQIIYVGGE